VRATICTLKYIDDFYIFLLKNEFYTDQGVTFHLGLFHVQYDASSGLSRMKLSDAESNSGSEFKIIRLRRGSDSITSRCQIL